MRPWIKLYTHRLDDVRLLRLDDRKQLRYFQLYMLAGKLNADGCFIENGEQLNETDIALKLRIKDVKQFQSDIKSLKVAGLIHVNGRGPAIKDFKNEQVDWSHKQDQDRERQARHRGQKSVTRDKAVTGETVTRKSRPQTKKKIKKKIKKEKEIKTTTTQPSASKSKRAVKSRLVGGGGAANNNYQDFINQLKPGARKTAAVMMPILRSSGLGRSAIETLMHKVAMRIAPEKAKQITLAAIASAYSDSGAGNKPVIAAYRIEHEQIPAAFFNSDTWTCIPKEIQSAAGVNIKSHDHDFTELLRSRSNDGI